VACEVVAVEDSHREEGIGVVTEDGVGVTHRTDGDNIHGGIGKSYDRKGLGAHMSSTQLR
jgi:hypothetical protein